MNMSPMYSIIDEIIEEESSPPGIDQWGYFELKCWMMKKCQDVCMGACGDGIQGLSSWFFFESVPKQRGIFNYYCLLRYYKYLILYK